MHARRKTCDDVLCNSATALYVWLCMSLCVFVCVLCGTCCTEKIASSHRIYEFNASYCSKFIGMCAICYCCCEAIHRNSERITLSTIQFVDYTGLSMLRHGVKQKNCVSTNGFFAFVRSGRRTVSMMGIFVQSLRFPEKLNETLNFHFFQFLLIKMHHEDRPTDPYWSRYPDPDPYWSWKIARGFFG